MNPISLRARRMLTPAVLSASLLLPAALHAQKVNVDYDHKASFAGYHTFSFNQVKTSNPLNEQRLRDDLTTELTQHGLQQVPTGGDLSVAAIGGMHTQQEYNTFYDGLGGGGLGWGGWGRRGWGGWGGGGLGSEATTSVEQVPVGSLRVDLYDNNTHQLVWRGLASDQLSDKSDKNAKKLNKAVNKMFDKFPPKGAQ